jgi:PAS domain S-box-containing protein
MQNDEKSISQQLIEALPGVLYRKSAYADGPIEFVSENIMRLSGVSAADYITNCAMWLAGIHPEDRAQYAEMLDDLRRTGRLTACRYRVRGADDSYVTITDTARPIFNSRAEIIAVAGILMDASYSPESDDLIRARHELEIQRDRARQLEETLTFTQHSVEHASTAIFWIDSDAKFIYVNDNACKKLGYSRPQILQMRVSDLDPNYPAHEWTGTWEFLKQAGSLTFETIHRTSDGREFPVEVTCNFVRFNGREYSFAFAVDITNRKQAELELHRLNDELKEQDRRKNEFISNISHEIRTPLCVFKNILSNALAGVCGPLNTKLKLNLEIADQNMNRLSRIINDFLDVSKLDAGKMPLQITTVNVQELVNEVITSFSPVAQSKQINLSASMPHGSIVIEADRDKIIQVISNLVGNAIKFTPVHGNILIDVVDGDKQVTIAVEDNGVGIKKADLDKLFDRFVQVRKLLLSPEHGTGLGLAIVKTLVEMHKGQVWAQSQFGRGSTFTFVLPKKQNAGNS